MNNRQKYKRLKKLYESGLPVRKPEIIVKSHAPKHIRVGADVPKDYEIFSEDIDVNRYIMCKVMDYIRPYVEENIKIEERCGSKTAYVDFWIGDENEN